MSIISVIFAHDVVIYRVISVKSKMDGFDMSHLRLMQIFFWVQLNLNDVE